MNQPDTNQAEDALPAMPAIDEDAAAAAVLHEKLTDAGTPGFEAEFSPDEAEAAGAFVEDALTEEAAFQSRDDLAALAPQDEAPTFITGGGPVDELPLFMDSANVRTLYGWQPGESLSDAILRKQQGG